MQKLFKKKFFKTILLALPILIVLQDVSYALSPTSRFRPITDSKEQLSQPPAAPAQAETVFPNASDVLKLQKENEPVPISPNEPPKDKPEEKRNGYGLDLSSADSPAVESDGDVLRQPDANTFTSQYMFEALKRYRLPLYANELVKEEFKKLGEMLQVLEEYLAKSGKTAGPPEILKMIDGRMHWSVSEEKIKDILKKKGYREQRIDLLIQLAHLHPLHITEKERLAAQIVAILADLYIYYFDVVASNPHNLDVILLAKQHLDVIRIDLALIDSFAVSVLKHILNTADPEHMGRAAAFALGLIDSPEAISVLVTALETAPEKVRKWVVIALGLPESLPVNVVSTLIDMLETTIDDELRYTLAITLCALTLKHPEITEKIERWMHNFVFNSADSPWVHKEIRYAELPALWFEGAKDILRQRMPTLIRILGNPYYLARFLFVLSVFRTKFQYFIANDIHVSPIAYARQTGIKFKLGELCIVPISESYRRHIIYTEDEDGGISALEIKIPGQHEDRNVIQETNFSVARELWKKYPSDPGVVKPLFFLRLNGQFPLYGRDIDFPEEEPLGIAGFEYKDGKRFRNIKDEFIEEIGRKKGRSFEEIMRSVVINILATTIRIHHLGYRGSSEAGTDMHNENLRILDDGRVVFVGDFGAFEYIGKVPWDVRREETAGLLGMFGPVVDWLLLGVIEKLTKVEPTKEARAQMASEAILELNRQEGLKSVMEILKKIQKGEEAISFADHSLSDIERKILTMVKKQKKASVFSYFLSLFKSEIGIFVKRKNGDSPDLSSADSPIKNVSKDNKVLPVSPSAPAHVETTKLAVELKDIKKSLREKLFAMNEAREALVKILDEIIKEELSPGGFVEGGRIAQIKKLHSKLTRANNPEDQKAIIAGVNFTMRAVRRIISKMQNKVKDDEMKDILGMQRRYDEIRNELVKENQGLVVMVAKDYLRKLGKEWKDSEDLSDDLFQNDLLQIGNMYLISAIEGFNPHQGFEFSTYAVPAIKRGIQRMHRQGLSEIPEYLREKKSEIDEFIAKFTQTEKREPAVEEAATGLKLPVSRDLTPSIVPLRT